MDDINVKFYLEGSSRELDWKTPFSELGLTDNTIVKIVTFAGSASTPKASRSNSDMSSRMDQHEYASDLKRNGDEHDNSVVTILCNFKHSARFVFESTTSIGQVRKLILKAALKNDFTATCCGKYSLYVENTQILLSPKLRLLDYGLTGTVTLEGS